MKKKKLLKALIIPLAILSASGLSSCGDSSSSGGGRPNAAIQITQADK